MNRTQTVETVHDHMDAFSDSTSTHRKEDGESSRLTPSKLAAVNERDATIMMVDDATTTLKILKGFLEDAGYQHFLPISEPADAFQTLLDNPPDAVLLDINMPGVSGFDILSFMRAREEFEYTPVIILTSYDDAETKLRALQMGATDFLAKPVDASELVLRLRNTLVAKRYLDQQTYYDHVTGLANRRLFLDRLDRAVCASDGNPSHSAVLLVNVDCFNKVNDGLGHATGDVLLQAIASRLHGLVYSDDGANHSHPPATGSLVARIGGDEFAVLLSDVRSIEGASRIAEAVVQGLAKSFRVEGQELFITVSIGIAMSAQHGAGREALLKHADLAMSDAKQRGGNCFLCYSAEMERTDRHRLRLESELHRALERQEFVLHYQPKVDVRTGFIVGAEALVRWEHPERGLVPPGEFITLAEESGLIGAIGDWVLMEACRQNAAWRAAGLGGLTLAVNLSGHQLRDRNLVGRVRQVLMDTGLSANYLTLELTEGVMIEDARENIEVLHALKNVGVNLSVDDFGTGYSSLSYLEQFPLDELKVDRSFISKIQPNGNDAPVVGAIITMAHSLRFAVVAEGVESEEQLRFLRHSGCEYYQGFLFSKPLPTDEFATLAGNWRPQRIR